MEIEVSLDAKTKEIEFMNIEQLKEFLKIKESFVRHLLHIKAIPCYRIGRLIRFDKDEIICWVKNNGG